MNRYVITALCLMFTAGAQADRIRPDVDVNVPPEVFSSSGQRAQPCNQCCIYQDQNYSEPAGLASRKTINASSSGMSAGAKLKPNASSGVHHTSALW